MIVISVRQAGGGTRYLALDAVDARAVRRDPAMLDSTAALACLDVGADGSAAWQWPFGCANTPEGKAAIREHRVLPPAARGEGA